MKNKIVFYIVFHTAFMIWVDISILKNDFNIYFKLGLAILLSALLIWDIALLSSYHSLDYKHFKAKTNWIGILISLFSAAMMIVLGKLQSNSPELWYNVFYIGAGMHIYIGIYRSDNFILVSPQKLVIHQYDKRNVRIKTNTITSLKFDGQTLLISYNNKEIELDLSMYRREDLEALQSVLNDHVMFAENEPIEC